MFCDPSCSLPYSLHLAHHLRFSPLLLPQCIEFGTVHRLLARLSRRYTPRIAALSFGRPLYRVLNRISLTLS